MVVLSIHSLQHVYLLQHRELSHLINSLLHALQETNCDIVIVHFLWSLLPQHYIVSQLTDPMILSS